MERNSLRAISYQGQVAAGPARYAMKKASTSAATLSGCSM
jgi:hypothetical protein